MTIKLATKTLIAFEHAVRQDQGSTYRGFLGKVIPHIGDAYRTGEDGFRSHMGASGIGQECARAIWYGFRWVYKPNFSGKMLRLFNRGHLEEARFIALLLSIGCKVYQQDVNGNQFRISHAGGHFGGSSDGVIMGLPDVTESVPALGEFKTHGDKSFIELTKKGLRDAKFQHYVQMQVYMRKMNLTVGFYLAVNKNTDELYGEIITLDTATADQFLDRGHNLVFLDAPPEKINKSPGFFKCTYCDFKMICHLGVEPEVNCRTCTFAKVEQDGTWQCGISYETLSKEVQLKGCADYIKHPSL
jgi:hypothetical protein